MTSEPKDDLIARHEPVVAPFSPSRTTPMVDAAKLKDLLTRIEAATEGDNDLDRDIAIALGWTPPAFGLPFWYDDEGNYWSALPDWSTSIDAALALVERVKPGWGCQVGRPIQTHSSGWYASVFRARLPGEHGTFDGHFSDYVEPQNIRPRDGYRPNGALAICLALLRSIEGGERG